MERKKLPFAEFELMQIIWSNPSPISTNQIIAKLPEGEDRKPQTVLTLLTRLIKRGFLASSRVGKDRVYSPLVGQEAYLAFESSQFLKHYHQNSFINLINTLYTEHQLTEKDIDDIKHWLDERG